MLRIVLIGMALIVIMLIIWIAWAEIEAFRAARERARHDELTGG
jgi:hypothetical protein